VLLYGSCLRTGNVHDGPADLYLLVDGYRSAFKERHSRISELSVATNVFYLEVQFQGQLLRASMPY